MGLQTVRYTVVEKVLDLPLQNPTYRGFYMGAYKTNVSNWIAEHALVYSPSLNELGDAPLVRINSACFTGDIFGDRRCDCTAQLHKAMDMIQEEPGLIIYHLHHEGRGLGLTSKLATYKHMAEKNISTFEAMKEIANRNDLRHYGSAILILRDLGIKRVKLITNNPLKKKVLEENGIEVVETRGIVHDDPTLYRYLKSKVEEQAHNMGHINFDIIND